MRRPISMIPAAVAVLLTLVTAARAAEITEATEAQLERWLQQYPAADANGDGKLTVEEANAYHRKLQRQQAEERGQKGRIPFAHEFTRATMSDGVEIALAVGYPDGFDTDSGRKWPAIFTMCGYTSATVPVNPGNFGNQSVTVNASIRGTGASGGALSPWTPRTWQDGYEIIEDWIVKQAWSNGRVGIVGHSWPGLMGFLVATTNPPSLKAVCVSGLIEDFYGGISWIGGVRNCGFPVAWLNSYYRPDGPFGSGAAAQLVRGIDEQAYRKLAQSRPERNLSEDMLWLLLDEPYDGPRWQKRSLSTYAAQIRAPILIMHTYQDEQTGPTGLWLWNRVSEDVPKRLILSNGGHNVAPAANPDLSGWFRHWLLGEKDDALADPKRRVQVYFETHLDTVGHSISLNPPLEAADFPLPGTRWTSYYLRSDGSLSQRPPGPDEPTTAYRVSAGDPGERNESADYLLDFGQPTAICGPIVLTLWVHSTTLDTDFFALVGDLAPDGTLYGLQRGLLRASHRELDEAKSEYVIQDGQRLLIRPRHPHTHGEPLVPRKPYRFEIEIFVVGHVFRPGHKLVLRLGRPPDGDPIGVTRSGGPSYQYDSNQPPGTVTILEDAEHASSVLLPVLPAFPPGSAAPPRLEDQAGIQPVRP